MITNTVSSPKICETITTKDAAAYAGVTAWTIRRWAKQGFLASCRLRGRMRFRTSDLDALMSK